MERDSNQTREKSRTGRQLRDWARQARRGSRRKARIFPQERPRRLKSSDGIQRFHRLNVQLLPHPNPRTEAARAGESRTSSNSWCRSLPWQQRPRKLGGAGGGKPPWAASFAAVRGPSPPKTRSRCPTWPVALGSGGNPAGGALCPPPSSGASARTGQGCERCACPRELAVICAGRCEVSSDVLDRIRPRQLLPFGTVRAASRTGSQRGCFEKPLPAPGPRTTVKPSSEEGAHLPLASNFLQVP